MKSLTRAILKAGSGSLATVLCGMVTIKLIAARQGTEALGSFSIIKQLIVAGSTMFITGGQTALVQGMSSRTGEDRNEFQATALALLCVGSSFAGIAMVVVGMWGGMGVLPVQLNTRPVMLIAGGAVAASGPMAFVFGSLNATRRIGRLAAAQAINACALVVFTWLVFIVFKVTSPRWVAAIIAGSQLPGIALGIWFLRGQYRLTFSIRTKSALLFANIAFATFAGALLQGWTVLYIRGSIAKSCGLRAAGVFDAGWTISMVYVMLIFGTFATYYLPTLAAQGRDGGDLIKDVLRTSLLLSVPMIAALMVLRPFVVAVLYSPEFISATALMRWMLLGDFFKILSFVLAMPMIALPDTKAFVIGEAIWNLAMVIGTHAVLSLGWRLEGIGIVFAISYLGYLVYAWRYCRKKMMIRMERCCGASLVSGVLVLVSTAIGTWNHTRVSSQAIAFVILGCLVHIVIGIRRPQSKVPGVPGLEAA